MKPCRNPALPPDRALSARGRDGPGVAERLPPGPAPVSTRGSAGAKGGTPLPSEGRSGVTRAPSCTCRFQVDPREQLCGDQ